MILKHELQLAVVAFTLAAALGFITPSSLHQLTRFHTVLPRLVTPSLHGGTIDVSDNELLNAYEDESAANVQRVLFFSRTSTPEPDMLSEFLLDIGALGVTLVDGEKGTDQEIPLFDEINARDLPRNSSKLLESSRRDYWSNTTVVALYPKAYSIDIVVDQIESSFPSLAPMTYVIEPVQEKDWVKTVQKTWDPIDIGDRIRVRFPWHPETSPEELQAQGRCELVLEGGRAFGTGDHPTTRMCAGWLETAIREHSTGGREDARVLDYGSGSGILGLVALKLGAAQAVGVEIDIMAILVSIANARANHLHMDFFLPRERDNADDDNDVTPVGDEEEKEVVIDMVPITNRAQGGDYEFEEGEVVDFEPFPILVANILANSLNYLEPVLARLTQPGGRIALAGILSSQADSVIKAYQRHFDLAVTESEGDWVLVSGTKRK